MTYFRVHLTSVMSSSTLQASWYGGKGCDQPPAVQLRLTVPKKQKLNVNTNTFVRQSQQVTV